jgi:hypothetical protein
MFPTKFLEEIKPRILCSKTFFFSPILCFLCDNVGKYGAAGQAADGSIVRRMRVASWITTATDIHWEYVTCIAFPRRYGYANAPKFYIIHTLLPLLGVCVVVSIGYTH